MCQWWLQISRTGIGWFFTMPIAWGGLEVGLMDAVLMQWVHGAFITAGFPLQLRPFCSKKDLNKHVEGRNIRSHPWKSLVKPRDADHQSVTQAFPLVLSLPWRTVVCSMYHSDRSDSRKNSYLTFLTTLLLSIWVCSVHSGFMLLWRNGRSSWDCTGGVVCIQKTVLIYLEMYTCIHFLM